MVEVTLATVNVPLKLSVVAVEPLMTMVSPAFTLGVEAVAKVTVTTLLARTRLVLVPVARSVFVTGPLSTAAGAAVDIIMRDTRLMLGGYQELVGVALDFPTRG